MLKKLTGNKKTRVHSLCKPGSFRGHVGTPEDLVYKHNKAIKTKYSYSNTGLHGFRAEFTKKEASGDKNALVP